MDMQLNKDQLRRERELRAWSQSHLAEVAGLSMRTVQRIETSGSASLESAKAIAAAFDTQVEALLAQGAPAVENSGVEKGSLIKRLSALVAAFAVATAGFGWWSQAYADQIMVDLAVSEGERSIASVHLLNEAGESSEANVNDRIKVKVISTKQNDGNVFVDAQVYFHNGKTFELSANPKLLVANKQSAAVSVNGLEGQKFHFIFTPHL
jgi:transcriptional regulator with XRE-family HTH domain